jgi:polar amino acid transport system substrate-binding protein
MLYKCLSLALCLGALSAPSQAAPVPPRLYITTENAPLISADGTRVNGSGADKVREIMARTGIAYTIEVLPWKRAYAAALARADACVFSTTRTPEREHLFKWIGPTDEGEWVLLARADRKLQINSLEDARTLRIGTYSGDARHEYLSSRGFLVEPAPNDLLNQKKLLMNRIDLWAASLRKGSAVLEQNGWAGTIVPVFTFARIKVYLACNAALPDALVDKMNAALDAMAKDGTTRRIERKYD